LHCRGCRRAASREFPVSLGTVPTAGNYVELERNDGVARLVLNRPERRNALSQEVMVEMLHALDTVATDETTRVLVIEGRGPAFSAGHDLAEMTAKRGAVFYQELFSTCVRLMTRVHELPQPVIAKVHGVATAAGCQLVAACDLAVASDDARFATPGVNIGLFCSTPMVPVARSIGRKRALEMLFTGEMIDARTALEWGLVNRVVAADRLDQEVDELARRIASASAYVLALGKRAFYAQDQLPEDGAYDIAYEVMVDNAQADDAHEGMRAFLEKRAPQWRNR
jgi:enoyl-CoA hydratase/carnithine racemase